MATNRITNISRDKSQYCYDQHTGMTPSIITTINNTSPTPLADEQLNDEEDASVSNQNSSPKTKRIAEPFYESYIEDSFVGHWEREDDDIDVRHPVNGRTDDPNRSEEEESMHPSTIEFDFDSFGPESFIYTPATTKSASTAVSIPSEVEPNVEVVEKSKSDQQDRPLVVEKEPILHLEKPDNSRLCALKPSPIEYLVDPAQIDLRVIEPYKKVISHAGYCHHFDTSVPPPNPGESAPAIIVFSACYLPDRSRRDYDYVMDHLFLYVLSSLHELIADDYILIYLHNTQPSTNSGNSLTTSPSSTNVSSSSSGSEDLHQNNLPTFTWMKRCYQMIDRRLRKNLKILYLVKPTFWLKTIVIMCRPFISTKFSKKLRFIENMEALKKCLPVDKLILPASADNL